MFTGIIEETAEVLERSESGLSLMRPMSFNDARQGSSISVSGVCLTVVGFDDMSIQFDVHEETWSKTNLGDLQPGDRVNLERAMKADGRFEGHIVQGHVDACGSVQRVMLPETKYGAEIVIRYPSQLRGLIVEKGSIAINGVSLTVCNVTDETFSVALIPETLKRTTLGNVKEEDRTNLEVDILGKYILSRNRCCDT